MAVLWLHHLPEWRCPSTQPQRKPECHVCRFDLSDSRCPGSSGLQHHNGERPEIEQCEHIHLVRFQFLQSAHATSYLQPGKRLEVRATFQPELLRHARIWSTGSVELALHERPCLLR